MLDEPLEFQPSSPAKLITVLQLLPWFSDEKYRDMVLIVYRSKSVGGGKRLTHYFGIGVRHWQTESSSQLWECQTAWVHSFPLVWGMTPCPLPHKSSGPHVFNVWSLRPPSTGVMPH